MKSLYLNLSLQKKNNILYSAVKIRMINNEERLL